MVHQTPHPARDPAARAARVIKAGSLWIIGATMLGSGLVLLSVQSGGLDFDPILSILVLLFRAGCALAMLQWKSQWAAVGLCLLVALEVLVSGSIRPLVMLSLCPGWLVLLVAWQTFRWHRLQRTRSEPAP